MWGVIFAACVDLFSCFIIKAADQRNLLTNRISFRHFLCTIA